MSLFEEQGGSGFGSDVAVAMLACNPVRVIGGVVLQECQQSSDYLSRVHQLTSLSGKTELRSNVEITLRVEVRSHLDNLLDLRRVAFPRRSTVL